MASKKKSITKKTAAPKPPAAARTTLPKIGSPATRALASAGVVRLEQLTRYTEAQLLDLHGMGPKAIGVLKEALAAKGMSFEAK